MSEPSYRDIPGTFVFDAEHSRQGYHLNMFMMSLLKPENRAAFKADEPGYLSRFPLGDEQRRVILERDWNGMLEHGGNVYYTLKLAATDGTPYEAAYAAMAGMERGDFRQMMLSGGRPAEGNQYRSDWEEGAA
ncbi:MAG: protocatechuate 4,5-dioxygenase subunit alpha [Caulobacterales bacterium]|nr:protocatechuate 4,5-dioxygenase subunit alpha [Caulobacterales bacterium]